MEQTKPTEAEKTAMRLAKMRVKKNLKPFTVNIDGELKDGFDAYLARTGKSRNEVIEHILRTQVLRKR